MRVKKVKLVYFSPTKTTEKILDGINEGLDLGREEVFNLTLPGAEIPQFADDPQELALIGTPVYGGRIPVEAVERIKKIKGNGNPAILVVLYGNREFDDALLELKDIAGEAGFIPLAGSAFIGEHSFSSDEIPIAASRPDNADLAQAKAFGIEIMGKLSMLGELKDVPALELPGNYPYKDRGPSNNISPITDKELCNLCGDCAPVCPTGAITVDDAVKTNSENCIRCCACVKICPEDARFMDAEPIKQAAKWLAANCSTRKEPETFF